MAKTVVIVDCDGTLSDGHVYVDSEGRESLRFHKRDGWLLREAAEAGIEVVVCTMDPNPVPSRERAVKMGLEHVAVTSAEGKRDLVLERKATGRGWCTSATVRRTSSRCRRLTGRSARAMRT